MEKALGSFGELLQGSDGDACRPLLTGKFLRCGRHRPGVIVQIRDDAP